MKINFKQPKYILPLILLPFLGIFFFVYQSTFAKKTTAPVQKVAGFNGTVGDVSPEIKKKQLEDKLDAYRNSYKDADGFSAVSVLPEEKSSNPSYDNNYSDKQKRMLDSINKALKKPPVKIPVQPPPVELRPKDPMETFKQQMAYIDSMNRANDPALKKKTPAPEKKPEPGLPVHKAAGALAAFNTIKPDTLDDFIKVVIDENLTGYAGSRIRLRLLDDINVGKYLIRKDAYLYALITGFSGQRVTLTIKSVLFDGKIFPVKLDVYDLDGLEGLYVPESAFRDFTKDLGTNTIDGVTMDGSSSFIMSTASKMFQSTSSALAGLIRKNKAKIKYNSYLYLIDKNQTP